jgi:hypothetical protein
MALCNPHRTSAAVGPTRNVLRLSDRTTRPRELRPRPCVVSCGVSCRAACGGPVERVVHSPRWRCAIPAGPAQPWDQHATSCVHRTAQRAPASSGHSPVSCRAACRAARRAATAGGVAIWPADLNPHSGRGRGHSHPVVAATMVRESLFQSTHFLAPQNSIYFRIPCPSKLDLL